MSIPTITPLSMRELAYNMEHAGLYELTHEEVSQLPPKIMHIVQKEANKACPVCGAEYRGMILVFTDLNRHGLEYWLKCANCEHVHRYA